MLDDKEIVGKDKDSVTPASTTHQQEELIPPAMSDEEDIKIDIQTVDKDSENETPAANPINEPEEACSQAHLVYRLICGHSASCAAYKTSATTTINEPDVACNKADLIYKLKSATIALAYYNNKNDTKFELVEDGTLASYPFSDCCGTFIHCVFNAKEDSSIKKFFAIIQYVWPSGPVVTTCKILEGDTKVDCELCRLAVPHEVVRDHIPDPPTFRPVPNFNGLEFMKRNGKVILESAILTAVVFISLTLYTFWAVRRGQDFNFLGPFLFGAIMVLIVFGFIQMLFPMGKISVMIYGLVASLIFCGYIIEDTNNIIKRYSYDEYICTSVFLYLDIINLFLGLMNVFRAANYVATVKLKLVVRTVNPVELLKNSKNINITRCIAMNF